jgi:acetylglutamate kinase
MGIVVLKMGGSVLEKLPEDFYQTIVELKKAKICDPIIVHGGGPEINQALKQAKVESPFVDGLRVTTEEVLEIAEMVMSGSINKRIVNKLIKADGAAFGLSGVDGSLLQAEPINPSGKLGFVGKVKKVNNKWLKLIMEQDGIPVISPIGVGKEGIRYNINGDMAAASVASSVGGKLIFVSDIPGVMETVAGKQVVHSKLTKQEIDTMITSGVIYGGMIPKVNSAMDALSAGIDESVIINGVCPSDLKDYMEGKNIGTKIVMGEVQHV